MSELERLLYKYREAVLDLDRWREEMTPTITVRIEAEFAARQAILDYVGNLTDASFVTGVLAGQDSVPD